MIKRNYLKGTLLSYSPTDLFVIIQLNTNNYLSFPNGAVSDDIYFTKIRLISRLSEIGLRNVMVYLVNDDSSINYSYPVINGPEIDLEIQQLLLKSA